MSLKQKAPSYYSAALLKIEESEVEGALKLITLEGVSNDLGCKAVKCARYGVEWRC